MPNRGLIQHLLPNSRVRQTVCTVVIASLNHAPAEKKGTQIDCLTAPFSVPLVFVYILNTSLRADIITSYKL